MNYRATCLFLCLALVWGAAAAQAAGRRHCRDGCYYTPATCQAPAVTQPGQPVPPAEGISNLPGEAQEEIIHFHKEVAAKTPELYDEMYNNLEGTYYSLASTGQQGAAAALKAYLQKLPQPVRLKEPLPGDDPIPPAKPPAAAAMPGESPKGKAAEGKQKKESSTPSRRVPQNTQSKIDALFAAVQAYKAK